MNRLDLVNHLPDTAKLGLALILIESCREMAQTLDKARAEIEFALRIEDRAICRACDALPESEDPVEIHDAGMERAARICDDLAAKAPRINRRAWFEYAADEIRAHKARPVSGGTE